MKFFIGLTLLFINLFADSITWNSYDKALELSKKSGKSIALMVTSEQCGYCTKMHNTTLSDKKVKESLESYFIPAIVDVSKEEMPVDYRFSGTPTFMFINSNGELIYNIVGYKNADSFQQALSQAMMRR